MPAKIFISSTMDDLTQERGEIAKVIIQSENVPVMAENFIDVENRPRDVIEKKVRECDAYIGLFHKRWGYIPKKDNPLELSVSAIEYEVAKSKGMPILVLISTEKKEPALEAFIDKISDYDNGILHQKYDDITTMVRKVALSIPLLTNNSQSRKYPSYIESAVVTDCGQLYLQHDVTSQKWFIVDGYERTHLVIDSLYCNITSQILELLKENKTVILTGPHGIGKSILARYVMALQMISKKSILAVERLNYHDVKEGLDIANTVKLSVLYDPMGPAVYEDRDQIQGLEFKNLEEDVAGISREILRSRTPALLVLPTDLMNKMNLNLNTANCKVLNVESTFKRESFLTELIRRYAPSCTLARDSHILRQFVSKLQTFNDGYTLIAAYIGRWLAKNNCHVESIEEALIQTQGKPVRFLQNYLWIAILNKDYKLAEDFALPLVIHAIMGPVSKHLAREIPISLQNMNLNKLSYNLSEWLSRQHEYLMEKSLRDLILSVTKKETVTDKIKNGEELEEIRQIIGDVVNSIRDLNEFDEYQLIDYKIIEYVQRWVSKIVNNQVDKHLPNLLNLAARCILLSLDGLDSNDNVITKYLMIGNSIPRSLPLILLGSPGKINDIFSLIEKSEKNYSNELSVPLTKIKQTGLLNEETYISILSSLLALSNQDDIPIQVLIDAFYGLVILTNSFPFVTSNIYWQTGMRLINKGKLRMQENKSLSIVLSNYLRILIQNSNGTEQVIDTLLSAAKLGNWIVLIDVYAASIHQSVKTHDKDNFLKIERAVRKYVITKPSTGVIMAAEIGPKLTEGCESFGEPYLVEFWSDEIKKAVNQIKKWESSNPDLKEYLEPFHHFGHYENKMWIVHKQIDVLATETRRLFRENKLRKAQDCAKFITTILKDTKFGKQEDMLIFEFRVLRYKLYRSSFNNTTELNALWAKTKPRIRSLATISFLEILSMYLVFSKNVDIKNTLKIYGHFLIYNNSIAIITLGFIMVKYMELIDSYWIEFINYLKSYADELDTGIDSSSDNVNSGSISEASSYPEIRETISSIKNNSAGIVGLIIFAYIKKNKKLLKELLNYIIINFGYIKVMKVVSENLMRIIEIGDGMNSAEFQNELLKLYFMRIS